ncbi:MAG: phosphodiester glycosidase family protein [Clostridiales bacterium]|nr:phosphodiester glycosidase family protein [Clostridiales bacterium]
MNFFRRKYMWAFLYGLVLTAFSAYVILDTFVIERVYTVVETNEDTVSSAAVALSKEPPDENGEGHRARPRPSHELPADMPSDPPDDISSDIPSDVRKREPERDEENELPAENGVAELMPMTSAVISENSYSDKNFTVTVTEYRTADTNVYVADITLSSSEFLKTAFADSAYGKNVTEKTSVIAAENNAFVAVNGDYYGAREEGYVIRNGVLYRNTAADNQEDLVIWGDGSFEIINESEVTAEELVDKGARQVLSFGPGLVEKGVITVDTDDEVAKAKVSNPRTAIGIIDDLHYVFAVADGRTDESEGLTLYQLAGFMSELGVKTAYNLDGGGSSVMYFNGGVINNPTTNGKSIKERSVSDIVYIGY